VLVEKIRFGSSFNQAVGFACSEKVASLGDGRLFTSEKRISRLGRVIGRY